MKEDLVLIEVFSSIQVEAHFSLLVIKYLRGNRQVFLIIQVILI